MVLEVIFGVGLGQRVLDHIRHGRTGRLEMDLDPKSDRFLGPFEIRISSDEVNDILTEVVVVTENFCEALKASWSDSAEGGPISTIIDYGPTTR